MSLKLFGLELFSSDERVTRALEQSGAGYDISPNVSIPANNDEPLQAAKPRGNSRLWLEGWSEKDEARVQSNDQHWEGYVA